ncbi:c-type cytochrome [Fulvivirga ulvae]|uniref:cbb3-type cytochrome c oxidase N-terminal domain-containing protein n=1 Tax=Fulvivirga ulvae TaxID=2904245 RepID=UPI001F1CFC7E|nr:cbb3-type cytochrome c oxidase N-terminal domain-containing protein [Fulvivirga ulvae]UII30457.1 c-type cytochrome [Fulvivirga ulvae]
MNKMRYFKALWLITLMMLTGNTWAQSGELSTTGSIEFYIVMGFVFVTALVVLAVAVVILQLLRLMVRLQARKEAEARGEVYEEAPKKSWWSGFLTEANDAVPVEKEAAIMLDHNYDGIRELDNHLPPWWKWLFYITIAFSVVYMAVYHVFGTMPLQLEEYQSEVALAEAVATARKADAPASNINEENVQRVTDQALLDNGREVFISNCAPCHKEDGAGGIGPNLTDNYWIHGGDVKSIFKTIKQGVPEKGMISWEPLLSPDEMQNVASFIMNLVGTNPPNAKGPQGELYEPETGTGEEPVPADSVKTAEASL